MIRANTQKRSATQRLDEIIDPLVKLRDELKNTEIESDSMINYAYNHNLPTIYANLTEEILKEIKRIYY